MTQISFSIDYDKLIRDLQGIKVSHLSHQDSIDLIIEKLKENWRPDWINTALIDRGISSLKSVMYHYGIDYTYHPIEAPEDHFVLSLDATDDDLQELPEKAMYVDGPLTAHEAAQKYSMLSHISNRYMVKIIQKDECI